MSGDILPTGYPESWHFDLVLKDGGVVRMRPILPTDGDALQSMLGRMSRQSVYQRFFRVKRRLDPEELRYFTELDYDDRMAFVVLDDGVVVGVGRYERAEGRADTAEVAFAVVDDAQGRGIGTALLHQLTAYARDRGIGAFRAYVLADNHAMLRVFRNAGYRLTRTIEEGVYVVDFPTEESPETLAAGDEQEKRAVAASLLPIFYPHSIAVIGASRDPASIGGRLFANLLNGDFTGPVYPVNPGTNVVRSVRAYPSITAIPDPVDLAFIVVPARHVIDVARECVAKGVRGIVVISAGFGETGPDGRAREEELLEVVRTGGLRMVGPNCMGVLNTDPAVSMDGQFGPLSPPRGNVAMSSQSGALGIAILDYAAQLNIGISSFVSVGNKADVSGNDLLLYWEDDPSTDVILLYLESFGNPRRFSRVARRIGRAKPIVAVKSGRTSAGARAASSHTGSLASLDVAVDAVFHQAGVIRTETLGQLFDVTALLANQPLPRGRRVGIVTNAGGPAILAVDALVSRGLDVVELSPDLQAALRSHLAPAAAVGNPVDMIAAAGPDEYAACLDLLLGSDELDAVIAIFVPPTVEGAEAVADAIRGAGAAHHGHKTFLSVYMSSRGAPDELASGDRRVPSYPFPEQAARALVKAVEYAEWRARPEGEVPVFEDVETDAARDVVAAALDRLGPGGGWLEAPEVGALLGGYGLRLPESGVARSEDEAAAIAERLGGPVVLKVLSASALHKSDVGGVVLDVEGATAIREAYRSVTGAVEDASGALVQQYVAGGHEVLIGMTEDPSFGPLVVFGLGGVFVELIEDVAFRIHPLSDLDAAEMIREVKSARLLQGYRGGAPGDVGALEEALLRVSALVGDVPEIAEMDLNPVKVAEPGSGVTVVDARVRVRPDTGPFVPSRRDVRAAV